MQRDIFEKQLQQATTKEQEEQLHFQSMESVREVIACRRQAAPRQEAREFVPDILRLGRYMLESIYEQQQNESLQFGLLLLNMTNITILAV